MNSLREDLLDIFQTAVNAVGGKSVVSKEIQTGNYPDNFHVIAIGKAADAMLQGLPSDKIKTALLISKHGHISETLQQDQRLTCIESDHPVPKVNTIKAGQALMEFVRQLPGHEPCVFLISGGASALVEVLEDGWDLLQLQQLTDYLLANAYAINEINTIRRRLSKIKGGGLWDYLGGRPVYCLMISDVPDDDPGIIGSGLLFPANDNKLPELPENWAEKINPYKVRTQGNDFNWKIIASLSDAKQAAANRAADLGYKTHIVSEFLQGEASELAVSCVNKIKTQHNILFIWGGESTVHLPNEPGAGGRNQHLALSAAIEIQGMENTVLLAAGTDGSDGMTKATGALVDGTTVETGAKKQLIAQDYLQRADSYSYFKDTDELIVTGATGTNVMDLVLAISLQ
jgi:hydroxypyruvate reductase